MTKDQIEQLKNGDIYWLFFIYLICIPIFVAVPFGMLGLAIIWLVFMNRQYRRNCLLEVIEEAQSK